MWFACWGGFPLTVFSIRECYPLTFSVYSSSVPLALSSGIPLPCMTRNVPRLLDRNNLSRCLGQEGHSQPHRTVILL